MMEERKVPALRFQGFTDGWEEKAIGELSEKTMVVGRRGHLKSCFGMEIYLGFNPPI